MPGARPRSQHGEHDKMTAFQNLSKASFDGIAFPVSTYEVSAAFATTSINTRIHRAARSKSWGASCNRCGTRRSSTNASRATGTTFGRAICRIFAIDGSKKSRRRLRFRPLARFKPIANHGWNASRPATRQSGVEVELEFVEDQSQAFLVNSIIPNHVNDAPICGNRIPMNNSSRYSMAAR